MNQRFVEIFTAHVPMAEQIVPNARLRDDLDLDSFEMMNIAIELEEAFGKVLSDANLVQLKTVGEIARYLDLT